MDKELVKKYVMMFRVSLAILAVTLVVAIVLLAILIPQILGYFQNNKKLNDTNNAVTQKEAELQRIKDDIAQAEAAKIPDEEMKVFYKAIKATGSASSDILAGEVQEINDLIKYYGIKIYKVNYTYDDENDNFYKGKKDKYSTCQMDLELFSNYIKFQGFLNDLYKHEHFLDIKSVEVKPYKKDKSILHIDLALSLYAEKDASTAAGSVTDIMDGSINNDELNLDF